MAILVGITERAILRILSELERDEFITITKRGRQNSYTVNGDRHLKHEVERNCTINDLVELMSRRDS